MIKIKPICRNEKTYYTVKGDNVPSMVFETDEEAQVIAAIINLLQSQNIEFDFHIINYVFRLLGIKSNWTE